MSKKRDYKKNNFYSCGCNYCSGLLAPYEFRYDIGFRIKIINKKNSNIVIYLKNRDENNNQIKEDKKLLTIDINFCWHCGKQLVKKPNINK